MRYDCTCRDDRIVPDRHAFCNHDACAYPDFIPNMDRCRMQQMSFFRIDIMVQGCQDGVVSYECFISDNDAALVLKFTPCIDENVVADRNDFPKICIERFLSGISITPSLALGKSVGLFQPLQQFSVQLLL